MQFYHGFHTLDKDIYILVLVQIVPPPSYKEKKMDTFPRDTFEDVIREAFTETQHPERQERADSEYSPDQIRVLGDMPVAACYLYNYTIRLAIHAAQLAANANQGHIEYEDLEVRLETLKSKMMAARDLMWVLIREVYPEQDNPNCKGFTILPDWKIAGVLITDADRAKLKQMEELQQHPLLKAFQVLAN